MEEEKVFLKQGNVFVSNTRIIIGGTTYATANITSVTKRVTPAKTGCAGFVIFLGVIGIIIGLTLLSAGSGGSAWGYIIVALVLLVLGILKYRSLKPTYHIVFASSSGQINALSSKDKNIIDEAVNAINQAIVFRG